MNTWVPYHCLLRFKNLYHHYKVRISYKISDFCIVFYPKSFLILPIVALISLLIYNPIFLNPDKLYADSKTTYHIYNQNTDIENIVVEKQLLPTFDQITPKVLKQELKQIQQIRRERQKQLEQEKLEQERKKEAEKQNQQAEQNQQAQQPQQQVIQVESLVNLSEVENQVLVSLNNIRTNHGLNPFSIDSALTNIARSRSKDMIDRGYFSHYTPDGKNIGHFLKANGIGYKSAGENLALATPPSKGSANNLVDAWMKSGSHKDNILKGAYSRVGIGIMDKNGKRIATIVFTG